MYSKKYWDYDYDCRRKPLRRSRDGILWGVCKGTADWLGMSAGVVRSVFIILLAVTGFFPFGLAYCAAALLIPLEEGRW